MVWGRALKRKLIIIICLLLSLSLLLVHVVVVAVIVEPPAFAAVTSIVAVVVYTAVQIVFGCLVSNNACVQRSYFCNRGNGQHLE